MVARPRAGATSTATATITPLTITCSASAIRMATPRADPARQRGGGTGPSPARRSPPPERQAAPGVSPEGGGLREEERSVPQFMKVATADELAGAQAKTGGVEG